LNFFSLILIAETLQAEICRYERFLKGAGHFDRPLNVEGDVAQQPLFGGSIAASRGKNCNKLLFVVTATALKHQISKFYLQILSTDASDHIYVSQL